MDSMKNPEHQIHYSTEDISTRKLDWSEIRLKSFSKKRVWNRHSYLWFCDKSWRSLWSQILPIYALKKGMIFKCRITNRSGTWSSARFNILYNFMELNWDRLASRKDGNYIYIERESERERLNKEKKTEFWGHLRKEPMLVLFHFYVLNS